MYQNMYLSHQKPSRCFCHAFVKLKFYRLPTTRCENDTIRHVFLSSFTVYLKEKRDGFWCVKTFIHTASFFYKIVKIKKLIYDTRNTCVSDIMTHAGHTYFYSSMTPDNPFIAID